MEQRKALAIITANINQNDRDSDMSYIKNIIPFCKEVRSDEVEDFNIKSNLLGYRQMLWDIKSNWLYIRRGDIALNADVSKYKQGLLVLKGIERVVSNQ